MASIDRDLDLVIEIVEYIGECRQMKNCDFSRLLLITDKVLGRSKNCTIICSNWVDRFPTVDGLTSFLEQEKIEMDNVFSNTNGLSGPVKICPSSVLGVFLRDFYARWWTLSFEDICDIWLKKIDVQDSTICASDFRELSEPLFPAPCEDIFISEKLVHDYFDGALKGLDLEATPIRSFISTRQQQCLDDDFLQQSMLSLANMWKMQGHSALSIIAIEEAVKISQHSGDHSAVSCATLLRAFLTSSESDCLERFANSGFLPQDETAIVRCVDQLSKDSTAQELCLLASIALLEVRSKRPIASMNFENREDVIDGSRKAFHSVQELWALYVLLLFEHPALLQQFTAKNWKLDQKIEFEDSALNAKESSSLRILALLDDNSWCDFRWSCFMMESEIWSRLCCSYLAELSCRRLLLQMSARVNSLSCGRKGVGETVTEVLKRQSSILLNNLSQVLVIGVCDCPVIEQLRNDIELVKERFGCWNSLKNENWLVFLGITDVVLETVQTGRNLSITICRQLERLRFALASDPLLLGLACCLQRFVDKLGDEECRFYGQEIGDGEPKRIEYELVKQLQLAALTKDVCSHFSLHRCYAQLLCRAQLLTFPNVEANLILDLYTSLPSVP